MSDISTQSDPKATASYRVALADLDCVRWMPEPAGSFSNRWLSCLTLDLPDAARASEQVLRALERHAIEARPVWKPMQLQPLYAGAPYFAHSAGQDVSAQLFASGMCLPSGSNLSEEQQGLVIDALRRAIVQARDARVAA